MDDIPFMKLIPKYFIKLHFLAVFDQRKQCPPDVKISLFPGPLILLAIRFGIIISAFHTDLTIENSLI